MTAAAIVYCCVQLTFLLGTAPFDVGELNVQLTVRTVLPGGCSTVTIAEVKARSVIVCVQLGFGHPGAPGMGLVGAVVVTIKGVFPFLISLAGIAWLPVTVSVAGFCPGA